MKKLFLLPLFLFILTTVFSQDISGPKPILSVGGSDITPDVSQFTLGCGVNAMTISASFTENLGSPDSYRAEPMDYLPKSYLPTAGNTVITPAQLGVPGKMLRDINEDGVINSLDDDRWSHVQSLDGLDFCYFGDAKTEFVMSSNGILSFDTSYADNYSSYTINNMLKIEPDANCGDGNSGNNDAILQFNDTDPNNSDADWNSYSFWSISGIEHERFLTWGTHHMPMYSCGADYGYATHQMVFFETTNIIEFHIKDKPLCDTWVNGWQAFGLQNIDSTIGFAVPGLDNLTQYQVLDQNDPYSASHTNPAAGVNDKFSYRFIPDGNLGTDVVFGWYLNWDNVNHTGTFITNSRDLDVLASDLPLDANGDPIPQEYTAVAIYVEYCSQTTYYATNNVTLEAIPVKMHIVENGSTTPNEEIVEIEQLNLCEGDDYLLQANVQINDPAVSYTAEWTVQTFGNSPAVVDDGDGDPLTYQITNIQNPPASYIYTCTITTSGAVDCVFSDQVVVNVFDGNTTIEYPAPKEYCATDDDPAPLNVFPVAPANATQDDLETYYYTITNGGVWLNPLASDSTRSLDGIVDLDESHTNASTFMADGSSAEFTITYHAHCPNNVVDDTIIIRKAPLVLNPAIGDPNANPVIDPSSLIIECETNQNHEATFNIDGINNYIANGIDLANLTLVWESQTGGVVFPNPMPSTYETTTISVKVTASDPNDAAACEVALFFDLTVTQKANIGTPVNNLKLCENDTTPGIATFNGTAIENTILGAGQDPAIYTVHYSYVDANGDTQTFDGPLPANYDSATVTLTAFVSDTSGACPSDPISFTLEVRTIPLVTPPTSTNATLELCETDTVNHTASFDTTGWDAIVLATNDQPVNTDFIIEYDYIDTTNTPVTTNALPNPFVSGSQTITVRSKNITNGEYTCTSGDETFDLVVKLKPVEVPQGPNILCSDETTNIDLTAYTTLSNNTYVWVATDNSAVDGETLTNSTSTTIADTLHNVSLIDQVVTYTVTPTADATNANCEGDQFTIDVTVHPEPVGTNTPVLICSGEQANQNLNDITTLIGNTYSWVVTDNPNVTGETLGVQTGNMITQTLTNTSTDNQDVIYTITPTSANGCEGENFTVTISVGVEPVGTDPNITTCSDIALNIDLDDTSITTLTGNTFSWVANDNVNVQGETVGVSTNGIISDTLTNTSLTPQVVTYTVTPTSANGCVGNDFTVTVTVNPEPVQIAQGETTCSNIALNVDLTTYTSLSNNTYEWVAVDNANVTGETLTTQNGSSITDVLRNITNAVETVTYNITATSADGCEGDMFTIAINVNPEPVGTDTPVLTCSDVQAIQNLNDITTLIGNTYTWEATDNPNVTGETLGVQTGNIITQTLTNTSTDNQDVIYTVTPTSANGCVGENFTVTINVGVEPIGTDPNLTICSYNTNNPTSLNVDLDDVAITTLTGNTFSWVATDNPNVTGETLVNSTDGIITDNLTNTTANTQTVTYIVTPTSANNCVGNDFTVTVTVNPEPVAPTTISENACSDITLDLDLNSYITNLTTYDNTFTWTAVANGTVSNVTTSGTTANITDTITNTSGAAVDVTYTITPTSADGCVGENFNIVVTVGDEPVGTPTTLTMCSDDSLSVDLNTLVNKAGTSFSWVSSANGTVTGVTPNGTANSITDTINNVSGASVDVTYTITPTNGCEGNEFTVIVTVNPEPVGASPSPIDACSDVEFTLNLEDYIEANMQNAGNTYEWQAIDNANVTGETTALTTSSTIVQTITNVSATPQTVTYGVTPISAAGCRGNLFTVDVEVGQKPVELANPPVLTPYCSNDVLNIDLNTFTTLSNNTYEWIATDNTATDANGDFTVTGETLTATQGSTITDAIKNISSSIQQVTYTITPTSANGCRGDDFSITVDINPEPVGELNIEEPACSDVPISLTLNSYITNLTTNDNTFTWVATDNPDVTGETIIVSNALQITDTLTNVSNDNQTVIYTVTPTSVDGCVGEPFEIKVNVGVEPVGDSSTIPSCSDDPNFEINLNDFITNLSSNDYTFEWYAENNNQVNGETTTTSSGNLITDTLTNTSGTVQNVIYHIIPTSAAPNECEGNEFIITVEVGFEPVGTTSVEEICNEVMLSLSLDSYTTLINNTYKWYAIDNPNVTGETLTESNTGIIEDTIINTTGVVQTVEYMITPTSAAGCVGDEFMVAVDVNPRPQFELKPQYLICPDVHEVTIGEDTNPNDYTYHWYEANDMSVIIGYDKTLEVTEQDIVISNGTYVLTVIDNLGCIYSQFTSVSMAEQMVITEIHVSDFNRPANTIQIDVTGGSGEFEYTLHYVDYANNTQSITQHSNVFRHVVAGTYQIEVQDLTGCSIETISQDIYVLDYPPFFTPNGDLQNDTWQIKGAQFIPNSKIYIFDRFGKVLAQVDPNSVVGWDGTYNGVQVPASDYWFTCEYIDPNTGKQKSVKGNFSIVRK